MRQLLAVLLTWLILWNSVPGGMAALVICFHPEGDAHVELLENKAECPPCCGELESATHATHCTESVDLVLETADLGSLRPDELLTVDVPASTLINLSNTFPEASFHPGLDFAVQYPTRGPPDIESLSQLISRSVVRRL